MEPAGRRFDLLVSGQAWHWVDPAGGARKASEVLRPGGHFAAFWKVMHHRPAVLAVVGTVYHRHAQDLLASSVALGVDANVAARAAVAAAALRAAAFRNGTEKLTIYRWQARYTPSAWIGLLRNSDHATALLRRWRDGRQDRTIAPDCAGVVRAFAYHRPGNRELCRVSLPDRAGEVGLPPGPGPVPAVGRRSVTAR